MKGFKRFVCERVKKGEGTYSFDKCLNEKGKKIGKIYIVNTGDFKAKGKLKKAIDEALN